MFGRIPVLNQYHKLIKCLAQRHETTLTQNENFTLYFFECIHIVVRFTHDYRDSVADNNYANLIKSQVYSTPEKRVPYVARDQEGVVHLQL